MLLITKSFKIMKHHRNALLVCCLVCLLLSCKKNINPSAINPSSVGNTNNIIDADCERKWFGTIEGNSHFPDTIHEQKLIQDGVASVPARKWGYLYFITYPIPSCKKISGDSIRLEIRVKNEDTADIIDFPVDNVKIGFDGKKNSAGAAFASDTLLLHETYIAVGRKSKDNVPELIHYFNDYSVIALETKNGFVNVYRDGMLLSSLAYNPLNAVSELRALSFAFTNTTGRSNGKIDWVKLYNSSTGAQIMQEDSNIDGTGSVIWF